MIMKIQETEWSTKLKKKKREWMIKLKKWKIKKKKKSNNGHKGIYKYLSFLNINTKY